MGDNKKGVTTWRGKPIRELSYAELKEALSKGELQLPQLKRPHAKDLYTLERLEKFLMGEMTWAQFQGMSMHEAYNIAEYAYALYEEGRYHDSRQIWEGLVLSNPYDAYFHTMLGAVYQQLDMREEAAEEYSIAIELDPKYIPPYVNRGELLLLNGEFERALPDLRTAMELDPEGKHDASMRARALAKATAQALSELTKGEH